MHKSIWRNFDWPLLLVTLILIAWGGLTIHSSVRAVAADEGARLLDNLVFRQGLFALVGFVMYFAAAAIDYRTILSFYRPIYGLILIMLAATALLGKSSFEAQRWVEIGGFRFQPSEFTKVLIILVLAGVLGSSQQHIETLKPLAHSIALVGPPVALIYLQPDFSTSLVVLAIWITMVFMAGVRWRHLLLLGSSAIAAAPVIWFGLKDYMRDRVLDHLFPEQASLEASYNTTQALISIGSGGWWGKGLFKGSQTQLYFLRVRHTDYIFCVLAEELGLMGSLLLLGLFTFLILRLVRIAYGARDMQGRLIATGTAVLILLHTFVNLGMNANILPVTGLPLPFISAGGSSLMTILLALGFVQSVAMRSKPPESTLL